MDLKQPISFDSQVTKLIEHGMYVQDTEKAKRILSEINYYRFSGYLLQYRKSAENSDFIDGVDFDDAYRIYCFDEKLRNILKKYLENIEVYYRTQIAYHFSMIKCATPPHDQHYDENNFYYKKGYNEVMEDFKKQEEYYKDTLVMKHHRKKYGNRLPLWVLTEMISFSDLSKLYKAMYDSEKQAIANEIKIGVNTLENQLHCLSVLRNKCAHAARLYNIEFNPPVKFSKTFLQSNPDVSNRSLYAYIVMLVMRLPNTALKLKCVNDIVKLVCEYSDVVNISLMGFPEKCDRRLVSFIR